MAVEIGGFIGLAMLTVGLFAWLRQDAKASREDMRRLEDRVNGRFDRLEARLAAVEHGQAKLEGLLEGLREAIAGRGQRTAAE